MKNKHFLTIIVMAIATTVTAQQAVHDNYVGVNIGGGLSTMLYKTANGSESLGGGLEAGLHYGHFFNRSIGLGVGLQYTWANAYTTYNWTEVSTGLTHPNNPNTLYNLNTSYINWRERQTMGVLSIPVELLCRKALSDRWAFIGGVGLSIDFPIHGSYSPMGGTYATTGVFPKLGNYVVSNLPEHGFDTYMTTQGGKMNNIAKVGGSVLADLGFRVAFNDNWGMYMGLYVRYGFTNLLAAPQSNPMVVINAQQQIDYSGTFSSDETAKVNLLRCGFKIAFDFGWPKLDKKEPFVEDPPYDEEAERLAREKAERERLAREAAEKAERERLAREAAEKAEAERLAREKAEKEAQWAAFKARIEGMNIYFANGSSSPSINDEDKAVLDELCAFLKANRDYKIVVIGHTDSYGDPEQNLNYYGVKRAEVLRDYIVNQGVDASQIRVLSKGQTEPVAPNDTRANRALNRRANIRFE